MKKRHTIRIALVLAGLIAGLLFVSQPFAQGQETTSTSSSASSTVKITFPIPELGNCSSKEECKAYCNIKEHIADCNAFGKARGLLTPEQVARNEKFKKRLEEGGTPGKCNSIESCRAFCEKIGNFETCIKFSKEHGLQGKNVEEGDKILRFLKTGGTLPGGCTSRETCDAYCKEEGHREECAAFAKNSGLIRPNLQRPDPTMKFERSSSTNATSSVLKARIPDVLLRCLKETIAEERLEAFIRDGKPLPEIDARLRVCKGLIEKAQLDLKKASGTEPVRPAKPIEGGTTIEHSVICSDKEACRKLCSDPAGQFYSTSDCVKFRHAMEQLRELQGDVPPESHTLPKDHACPDETTCAARCENSDSDYFLKPECVEYRENHPVGFVPNRSRLFLGNILKSFVGFFR